LHLFGYLHAFCRSDFENPNEDGLFAAPNTYLRVDATLGYLTAKEAELLCSTCLQRVAPSDLLVFPHAAMGPQAWPVPSWVKPAPVIPLGFESFTGASCWFCRRPRDPKHPEYFGIGSEYGQSVWRIAWALYYMGYGDIWQLSDPSGDVEVTTCTDCQGRFNDAVDGKPFPPYV
jgi:hypothetical protein